MSTSVPTVEPARFRAGETVKWTKALADYAPGTWTLAYYFNSARHRFSVTATDNGDGSFLSTIAAATTESIPPGRLAYVGRVSKDAEVFAVVEGEVDVLPNLAGSAYVDERSVEEQLLEKVEKALLGAMEDDVLSTSIDGVSITAMDRGDLLTVRSRLKRQVDLQRKAIRLKRGVALGGSIAVRG